jgi:hypothetical protein
MIFEPLAHDAYTFADRLTHFDGEIVSFCPEIETNDNVFRNRRMISELAIVTDRLRGDRYLRQLIVLPEAWKTLSAAHKEIEFHAAAAFVIGNCAKQFFRCNCCDAIHATNEVVFITPQLASQILRATRMERN